MMTVVDRNSVVTFHYTVNSLEGDTINTSRSGDPSSYLHGYGNIATFLEQEFRGKKSGDRFTVVLPPDKGYGRYDNSDEAFVTVPKETMPKGIWFQKGFPVQRLNKDNKNCTMYMHDYRGGSFTLTSNHPLAGVTLVYNIEIISVRSSLPMERKRRFMSCQIPINSPICVGKY